MAPTPRSGQARSAPDAKASRQYGTRTCAALGRRHAEQSLARRSGRRSTRGRGRPVVISALPLRDRQYAMCHADARTTMRYDMARANLDRHAAHSVAAYLAGMAIG